MTVPLLFTRDQVRNHPNKLVIIDSKVYNVTDFIPSHPGGDVIMTHTNGEDATDVFQAFHPDSAYEVLCDYYIGDITTTTTTSTTTTTTKKDPFALEIELLRRDLLREGLFESNKLYYLFKVLFNYTLLLASLLTITTSLPLSALLLAVFWQQSGWLAHDFLHHQVFKRREYNNAMGYLLGNLGQGFSVGWWKSKHNKHHASPNVHGLDPDIDTMPILGWSEYSLDEMSGGSKFMIFNQQQLYFVILTFARLSWCLSSLEWVIREKSILSVELITLILHWSLYLGFVFSQLSVGLGLLYVMMSQGMCGLMLSLVFSLNHNAMPIFSLDEAVSMEFYRKQVLTGRDVVASVMSTWFTGGLNYQIEHHLFPSLPRHNFHKVQARVMRLCKKYGVRYHVTGFVEGTFEVVRRLGEVSRLARERY